MHYRADIDGLRAVSVLSVVVFHIAPEILPGGYVGVDIFFVISGFLISRIVWNALEAKTFSFASFYARRARRLLPALYVTLIMTLMMAVTLFPLAEMKETAFSAISAIASLSNVRFALQEGYFDDSAYRKSLLHTWSLSVEEQFYLVWPLLLHFAHTHRHRLHTLLAIPALVVLVVASEVVTRSHPATAYFGTPFRFFQFALGGALHLFPSPSSGKVQAALSLAGSLAISLALLFFTGNTPFPGFAALVPSVGAALLLHSPQSHIAALLSYYLAAALGRISYSVYLVHWPLIVAYRLLSPHKLRAEDGTFLFVASLALGYALHHSVEMRFRHPTPSTYSSSLQMKPGGKPGGKSGGNSGRTILWFAGIGVLLCCFAYGTNEASTIRHNRNRKQLESGATSTSQEDLIPGLNIKLLRTWLRRTSWSREAGSTEIVLGKELFKRAHYTYRPVKEEPRAKILLIGDSHAKNLRSMFLRVAIEQRFQLDSLTKAACNPLLNLTSDLTMSSYRTKECAEEQSFWRKKILERHYDFVILVSRMLNIFEGPKYGPFKMKLSTVLRKRGAAPLSVAQRRKRYEEALRDTLRIVLRSGARAIPVSQWPHLGRSVRGCLELPGVREQLSRRAQPSACLGVSRRQVLMRANFMHDLYSRVANENQNVTSLLTSRYFCDNWNDTHCRTVYNGSELYSDQNHLSGFGVMFLSQRWTQNSYGGIDWTYRNPYAQNKSIS